MQINHFSGTSFFLKFALVIPVLLLAACGGTESEIEDAINEAINDKSGFHSKLLCHYFPNTIPKKVKYNKGGGLLPVLEALKKAGHLKMSTSKANDPTNFLTGRNSIIISFEQAADFLKAGTENNKHCFGEAEVTEIVEYTEPTESNQGKVTNVTYKWRLNDLPDWVENHPPAMELDFIKSGQKENEASIRLVKTNKGWRS